MANCRHALVVVTTVALVACKDSDPGALDDFGRRSAVVVCDRLYTCCQAAELAGRSMDIPDRAACERKNAESLGGWAAAIAGEERKGRLTFHRDSAQICLDSYRAATCEDHKSNTTFRHCEVMVEPKTTPGAPCAADESCVGGSCRRAENAVEGVCVADAQRSESCAAARCARGLFCQPGTNLCVPVKDNGESCNLNSECASAGCNGRNLDAGTPGTCGLKGGTGTTCFATIGCSFSGSDRHGGAVSLVPIVLGFLVLVARRRTR